MIKLFDFTEIFFFCFFTIQAQKDEDEDDMEDLQRWAMEAM